MFRFTVKYLGFLKSIPIVPHLFDALLKMRLFLVNRSLLALLDTLEHEVSRWPGVVVSLHPYGGLQFNIGNREIGHLHGNGLLDVALSRSLKAEILQQYPTVLDHHLFKDSGWISFWIKHQTEYETALAILRKAYSFQLQQAVR